MKVALLGFGLIGGSIAYALRRNPADWQIAAWSPSGSGPAIARAEELIDEAADSPGRAVRGADLVVIAAPPLAALELIDQLAGPLIVELAPDALVTDVVSTKQAIVARAEAAKLRFVGGHPMAGREVGGFDAARADLFSGRAWVVVPASTARYGDRERVEMLAEACGGVPVGMAAADHDTAVAAISHLPLVVAAALVESVAGGRDGAERADWPTAAGLAATGWEGMTRLARGNVAMGTGIAATNAPAIAARLRDLRSVLDAWLTYLERPSGPDAAQIEARLRAARDVLVDSDAAPVE
ncbi:MAG TPA: prephenate dehydrogenase/arogenate dehydrogenase family protein [Candidatus Limnocylindrales bacterium]|nr:prephenate dehydrogenase/arogenate dehydrogenase family protein [Candidatus Limnocylindrales bacterium]